MKLSEITLERVKEAYAKTDLIPAQGSVHDQPSEACALQALAAAEGKDICDWGRVIDDDTIDNRINTSFWRGFDGRDKFHGLEGWVDTDEEAFNLGRNIAIGLGLL